MWQHVTKVGFQRDEWKNEARWLDNFFCFDNCEICLYWVDIYEAVGCVLNETFLVGECSSFVIVRFLQSICTVACGLKPFPLVDPFYLKGQSSYIYRQRSILQDWTSSSYPQIYELNLYFKPYGSKNIVFRLKWHERKFTVYGRNQSYISTILSFNLWTTSNLGWLDNWITCRWRFKYSDPKVQSLGRSKFKVLICLKISP